MATPHKSGGILRTDYETDHTRLDDFPVLESDWQELLLRLTSAGADIAYREGDREGILGKLLDNHVLIILADIVRKKISDYKNSQAGSLQKKIKEWTSGLESFIYKNWIAGNADSTAVQAARLIKEQLDKSLPVEKTRTEQDYYRMLHALRSIQGQASYYLDLTENSGDMDGALALLLIYLKNYCHIAHAFNGRFASLPELYRKQVLHVRHADALPDHVYVAVTPKEEATGFTLPPQHPFPAGQTVTGEDLIYQTTRNEYISPIQCVEVNAVYIAREKGKAPGIRKQAIPIHDVTAAETLFDNRHSEMLPLGWQLESSMLTLGEGERTVDIRFRLTAGTPLPGNPLPSQSFSLQLSTAEGWAGQPHTCRIGTIGDNDNTPRLCFRFTLANDAPPPMPCTGDIHGTTTTYPALRILTDCRNIPYEQAAQLKFDAVGIQTEVSGIRNFTLCNELGEVDTSQPFSPFGIQANKGAWFLFGNEEMGLKPLKEIRLKGRWQKLPGTEIDFDNTYKGYTANGQAVCASSFRVSTEWQKGGAWNTCTDDGQPLFTFNEKGEFNPANLSFAFTKQSSRMRGVAAPYAYSRDRDGFFRVTLQTPSIGFGTDAYRALFIETMVHNSHCKEKAHRPLPAEPVIPLLADAELSYIASEETAVSDTNHSSLRLSRITALSAEEPFPIDGEREQPFLPAAPADRLLCFAFLHACGEQTLRMYLDMVLPPEKIPFYNPQPDKSGELAWEYRDGNSWQPLPLQSVIAEETRRFTQSGFVEIKLPQKIKKTDTDRQGKVWLRAILSGEVDSCLAIRSVQTNYIRLTALNSDGSPLPAGTIQGTGKPDERFESIAQPSDGFGGRPAETQTQTAVRQSAHIDHRHRAVRIKDYELLTLEHFPEVNKVQCIPVPAENKASEICLVVFCSEEDSRYFLSPAWKLSEIQRIIRQYTPPFVSVQVINPVYERLKIHGKAILWERVQDKGKVIRQLVVLAQNYIAPWYRKKGIPELRQSYSYNELHARMVNHEDLMKLVELDVTVESSPLRIIDDKNPAFKGQHPWSVLLPEIKIELLSPNDGIDEAEIGANFIIG